MTRLFLGPIKNPTWKDFFIRVGGALALIVVVILAAQAFIPESQGITVIVVSAVLIAFVAIQEIRTGAESKPNKAAQESDAQPALRGGRLAIALREWLYTGDMYDLETPSGTCELCEHPEIRYQFKITNRITAMKWPWGRLPSLTPKKEYSDAAANHARECSK